LHQLSLDEAEYYEQDLFAFKERVN